MQVINIEKTIQEAGISQYRLSKIMGSSPSMVWGWLSGRHKPSLEKYALMESKLNEHNIPIVWQHYSFDTD